MPLIGDTFSKTPQKPGARLRVPYILQIIDKLSKTPQKLEAKTYGLRLVLLFFLVQIELSLIPEGWQL